MPLDMLMFISESASAVLPLNAITVAKGATTGDADCMYFVPSLFST